MKKKYILLLLAVVTVAIICLVTVLNWPERTTFGEIISPEDIENIDRMTVLELVRSGSDGFGTIDDQNRIHTMLNNASDIKLVETEPTTSTSDYLITFYSNGYEDFEMYTGSNYMEIWVKSGGSYTIDGINTLHQSIKNSEDIEWEYLD